MRRKRTTEALDRKNTSMHETERYSYDGVTRWRADLDAGYLANDVGEKDGANT